MADGETIRYLLRVRVTPSDRERFLDRYAKLGARIQDGLDGHVAHELCQSIDDPECWVIASRWESLEASQAWERSEEHGELTASLRECWYEAERSGYVVRADTRRREAEG